MKMKDTYPEDKLKINERCGRVEPAVKTNKPIPVPIKEKSIKIAGIKAIMDRCVDKVIELEKDRIHPKVLLLPDDGYWYIQAYLSVSQGNYSSVEDWAYQRFGIGTVVHGKHIHQMEVY
jgi:hypothetical protein